MGACIHPARLAHAIGATSSNVRRRDARSRGVEGASCLYCLQLLVQHCRLMEHIWREGSHGVELGSLIKGSDALHATIASACVGGPALARPMFWLDLNNAGVCISCLATQLEIGRAHGTTSTSVYIVLN